MHCLLLVARSRVGSKTPLNMICWVMLLGVIATHWVILPIFTVTVTISVWSIYKPSVDNDIRSHIAHWWHELRCLSLHLYTCFARSQHSSVLEWWVDTFTRSFILLLCQRTSVSTRDSVFEYVCDLMYTVCVCYASPTTRAMLRVPSARGGISVQRTNMRVRRPFLKYTTCASVEGVMGGRIHYIKPNSRLYTSTLLAGLDT